jgi:hypothetical protein
MRPPMTWFSFNSPASVNAGALPQPRDFVLQQQLATLQLHDLQTIRGWVRHGIIDFLFECLVPLFEFRKMRLHGHMACLLCQLLTDRRILHQNGPEFDSRVKCAPQNPRTALPTAPWLEHNALNRDNFRTMGPPSTAASAGPQLPKPTVAMTNEEERELQEQLARLQQEHRDLDAAIVALQETAGADILQVQRLKKRKLYLRDRISFIEDQLTPDIIA